MSQQQSTQWSADLALPGFEAATLHFPDDYDGTVTATLVRRRPTTPTRQAILYVHGYMDYFFQAHLAEQCTQHGYNFYALDLRKYGRALDHAAHPHFCKDIREYFPEISAALLIMTEEDANTWVVLNGHSTGGLLAALYAHAGAQKARIQALVLNSPFFDFNFAGPRRRVVQVAARVGRVLPFAALRQKAPLPYMESIHAAHHGEWSFDLEWRPLNGFPIYLGWLRAIVQAHQRVRRGLAITCPVLLMHSDKSVYGSHWHPGFQTGDGVLNVAHIRAGSQYLGSNVQVVEIRDGMHDLVLSGLAVRGQVFAELFGWLASLRPAA